MGSHGRLWVSMVYKGDHTGKRARLWMVVGPPHELAAEPLQVPHPTKGCIRSAPTNRRIGPQGVGGQTRGSDPVAPARRGTFAAADCIRTPFSEGVAKCPS